MDSNELIVDIARNWFPNDSLEIQPVTSGSSCDSFTVHTGSSKYILRGFSSFAQAELEACMLNKLSGIGISPEIIPTRNGTFYAKHGDMYYNLQQHIAGSKPNFSKEAQIKASSMAIATMHKQLSNCTNIHPLPDRFDTTQMIREVSSFPSLNQLFPNGALTLEEKTQFIKDLESQLCSNQVIHGDLGNWNMIWDGSSVCIIDFGECRLGDYHFDLAAAISCILSHSANQFEFQRRFFLFKDVYEKNCQAIDSKKLHHCLYLWLLRGALASLIYIQNTKKQHDIFTSFCLEISKVELFYKELAQCSNPSETL